ncbi:hypothetical protein ALC56_12127, partial [Trachymyrmex septentrionalis]
FRGHIGHFFNRVRNEVMICGPLGHGSGNIWLGTGHQGETGAGERMLGEASYVGQTGRQLKTRITEHRNHIRYNTSVRSVITELQDDRDFQWDNVKILNEEPCYKKRLISEMLNIKKQKNSLNLQT